MIPRCPRILASSAWLRLARRAELQHFAPSALALLFVPPLVLSLALASPSAHALPPAGPATALNRESSSDLYAQKLAAARTAYFQMLTSGSRSADRAAHAALDSLEQSYPGDPTAEAYHGSLQLLDAAHDWQIWNLHRNATEGLARLDQAVAAAPDNPEVRFMREATSWHLPAFYHRRPQCEADFAWLATHAACSARAGTLPPELAAASLNYWGQILIQRGQSGNARRAFQQAVELAPSSPAATDAARHLRSLP